MTTPKDVPSPPETSVSTGRLGTFTGVFTPSVLTILGIILFLRLGYVMGSAGLERGLIIIALANVISVLTSISLSAVATNIRVKGGGDYYLISRTLGLEFGGSIGLVLFLAQSISIAFYCMGFAEAIASFFPNIPHITVQLIAAGAVAFLFIFAWQGADWATKFQFGVMALLVAALLSFFIGGIRGWDPALLAANWASPENGVPFWVLFAIFFPAVTGFTQGVSMSGDLADPGKSIPLGTFLAVGISIIVYFSVAVLFAGTLPNATLASNFGAMKSLSAVGFLIDAGVIAATLSSAMASFMGAPRILQSLAADRIFTLLTPFAKVSGSSSNPRRGILFSAGIAFATIALGKLNLIASVVSMFFLISYGLLNYATYFEATTQSPSFRPRFKWFSPQLSLLGFLICLGAMLAIDFKSGAAAIALLFAVYQYLKRTAGPARWADSNRSHHLQQVRKHLLATDKDPEHARDWRPHLLVFTQTPEHRAPLLRFASWIEGGSGFVEAVQIIEGEGSGVRTMQKSAHLALIQAIASGNHEMFPLTVTTPNFSQAMGVLLQSSGIGPLRPNTVVFNWMGESVKALSGISAYTYARNLKLIFRQGKNMVILRMNNDQSWRRLEEEPMEGRRIDVWWKGDATSRLMLLLAYLMTRNKPWDKATLRVLTQSDTTHIEREKEQLSKLMENIRIDADAEIVENFDAETIVQQSADAAFVFLPLRIEQYQILDLTGKSFERSLPRLPVSALVMAAEDLDLDAPPDEGLPAQIARANDDLELARKKSVAAEKIAAEKMEVLEKLNDQLEAVTDTNLSAPPPSEKEELEKEIEDAESDAEDAHRRAIKAKVKADDAAKVIDTLDPG